MFYFNEKENGLHSDSKRETAKSNDTFLKAVGTKRRWNKKVTLDMIYNTSRFVHIETILLAQTYLVEKDKPHWSSRKKADLLTFCPVNPHELKIWRDFRTD